MPKPKFASQRHTKSEFYGNRFVNNNQEQREDVGNGSDALEDELMYQSIPKPPIPPPRAIPGHLTRVKLRTVGNLTQNEARPVGHLTFESKRLSAVGNKRISRFFDSAREPRSRVIALVDSKWIFLLLSVLYSYIVDYAFI